MSRAKTAQTKIKENLVKTLEAKVADLEKQLEDAKEKYTRSFFKCEDPKPEFKPLEYFLGIQHVCRIAAILEKYFWDVGVGPLYGTTPEMFVVYIHGEPVSSEVAEELLIEVGEEFPLPKRQGDGIWDF